MTKDVSFQNKSFCFTGKLADLKRSQAEREARARGAFTSGTVNPQLDYLVVGSIPATGWKHGSYGTKIEKARQLRADGNRRPVLVPESEFMDALATAPVQNSGALDTKVVVYKYKFTVPELSDLDENLLEQALDSLSSTHDLHIRTNAYQALSARDIFEDEVAAALPETFFVVEVCFVKELSIEASPQPIAEAIAKAFEPIPEIDGRVHFFEVREGSATYIRLIREVPRRLRLAQA